MHVLSIIICIIISDNVHHFFYYSVESLIKVFMLCPIQFNHVEHTGEVVFIIFKWLICIRYCMQFCMLYMCFHGNYNKSSNNRLWVHMCIQFMASDSENQIAHFTSRRLLIILWLYCMFDWDCNLKLLNCFKKSSLNHFYPKFFLFQNFEKISIYHEWNIQPKRFK